MNTKPTPLFNQDLSLAQFYERVLECAMTSSFSFSMQNSLLSIAFQKFYELLLLEDYLKAFKNTQGANEGSLTKTIKVLKKKVEFFLKNIDIACLSFSKHFHENGYVFKKKSDLNPEEKEKCIEYIKNEIIPILEFTSEKYVSLPHDSLVIFGKHLNKNKKEEYMFSSLPKTENIFKIEEKKFVFLGDILSFLFDELSKSYGSLKELSWFIPLRTDSIEVEEFVKDQNCIVDFMIRKNPQKKILALLVPEHISQETTKKLSKILHIEHNHIFKMTDIFFRKKSIDLDTFLIPKKDNPHEPTSPFFEKKFCNSSVLEQIFEKDVFLQTPFDDFNFLIDFIVQSSKDPNVVSIKQTIYRCPVESPLVDALLFAVRKGKKVSAVVETRASMDEQNNILIAEKLRQNGANLAYGKPDGLTHAKLCLISQIKDGETRNFLHVGTGNYNVDNTSRYTDFSLFTSSEDLCRGAENLFNNMFNLNNSQNTKSNYFYVSGPNGIKDKLISLILSEIENKKNGNVAGIYLKCSRLLDPDIIQHLYMASQAGVPCELIIRSVCALEPGVKEISENIRVKSVVGPFLEHSRAYCFCQGGPLGSGKNKIFISSADLMRRSFEKRVEIMVMILDSDIRKRITKEIFLNYIEDNQNSWILQNNGTYLKIDRQNNQELNVYKQLMYKKN